MTVSYARWVGFIERRYRLIVAGSVLVCVVAALSLTRLRLDIDVLSMLPQGAPAFDDFKSFVADFGELDELVVFIDGSSLPRLEAFAEAFAGRLRDLNTVATVQARIDVAAVLHGMLGHYLYNFIPEADYAEVERRLTPAAIDAQVAADRAILSAPFDLTGSGAVVQDPLGFRRLAGSALSAAYGEVTPAVVDGYFASAGRDALLIMVRPRQSPFDIQFCERLLRQVRQAEAETRRAIGAPEGLRVAYTGSYVYALEDAATLHSDIRRYTVLALLGVLAVFYAGYRGLGILPFVTYPLVVTTLLTFGLSLALFEQLNAVSMSFAAILYGLSIDSGIYFYTRLLQERQSRDLRAAITATLAGLGRANLAACATTAVAFFVVGFSCLSAVRQLGILTGVGMLLTTVQFFTLFPALGFCMSGANRVPVLDTPRLGRWARASAAHCVPVATSALLVGVGSLFVARHVSLDVTLTHLRPQESKAVRVQEQIEARFGARQTTGAVLVRRADLEAALVDSEAVAARLAAYKTEGVVASVQSVAGALPSVRVQHARLARYNALPRAAAIETVRASLKQQGFVPERFDEFFSAFSEERGEVLRIGDPALTPLSVLVGHHVRAHGSESIVATYVQPAPAFSLRDIDARLRRDLPGVAFTLAGRPLLEEQLRAVLGRELAFFFTVGLVGNFILLLISFGSVATAAAILLPVVLVVIALFAAMAATGVALDPINLIATPLLFGIGVDYGVYIVARAREGGGVTQALGSAGRAVVVTALTTVAGFGFLGLSHFPPLATMGLLAAAGLFLCLSLSIILLPALLRLLTGLHAGGG